MATLRTSFYYFLTYLLFLFRLDVSSDTSNILKLINLQINDNLPSNAQSIKIMNDIEQIFSSVTIFLVS